ncbi:hypothetical protein ACLSU7_06975 [Bdellovibrio sp. HCB185ZH]|uniref:hypothetical protein n=1 Tax=Bdellovibrio sp. HCB185ZH TaxID=3394235 RepID=UPI0039A60695
MKAIALYPTQHLKSWLHDQLVDFDNELIDEAMIFLIPQSTPVLLDDAKSFSFLKTASGRFMTANAGVKVPNLSPENFGDYFRYEVFSDVVNLGRSAVAVAEF